MEDKLRKRRKELIEDRSKLTTAITQTQSRLSELTQQLHQFNGAILAIDEFVPPEEEQESIEVITPEPVEEDKDN
tara:strand:+ start:2319 stop:2543 length:225 start_codon:yes stop_codon:yes gene_type:complete